MTVQAEESKHSKKGGLLSGLLGGGKTIWAIAIVSALVTVFAALNILGNAAATQTYYVLGREIPARTQITPDMLVAKEAKVGEAPPTAFDVVYVRDNAVFSQYPLNTGDVISASNAGPLERINADLPDNFVAASFSIPPENAVAGKVRKGDFIDLIASTGEGDAGDTARVVLQHVLVLDVTVSPDSIAQEANDGQEGADLERGPESEAVRTGIPQVYTVGVSPEDATKLALVRPLNLFVVLSANLPDLAMNVQSQLGNVLQGNVGDSSAGTPGSVFLKRWEVAFSPGNVYVDADGNVWKVDKDGLWAYDGSALEPGDLPPGYLPVPEGTEFLDADNLYWVVEKGIWTSPENDQELGEGDNPVGFDPFAEFASTYDTTDEN